MIVIDIIDIFFVAESCLKVQPTPPKAHLIIGHKLGKCHHSCVKENSSALYHREHGNVSLILFSRWSYANVVETNNRGGNIKDIAMLTIDWGRRVKGS